MDTIRIYFTIYDAGRLEDFLLSSHYFYPVNPSGISDVIVRGDKISISFSYTSDIVYWEGYFYKQSIETYTSLKFYNDGYVYITYDDELKRGGELIDRVPRDSILSVSPDGKYIGLGLWEGKIRLYSSEILWERSYVASNICINDIVTAGNNVYSLEGELVKEFPEPIYACSLSDKYYLFLESFSGSLYDKDFNVLFKASHRPIDLNRYLILHDFIDRNKLYIYDFPKLFIASTPRIAFQLGSHSEKILAIASRDTLRIIDLKRLIEESVEKEYYIELKEKRSSYKSKREKALRSAELAYEYESSPVEALKKAEEEGLIIDLLRLLLSDDLIDQLSSNEFLSLIPPEDVESLKHEKDL